MIKRFRKLCLFLLVLTGLFTLSGCSACSEAEHHVYAYDCRRCRTVAIPSGLEIAKFDYVVTLTNVIINIEYKRKIESGDSTTSH